MKEPKVAVVIPAKNAEKTLEKAFISVFNQKSFCFLFTKIYSSTGKQIKLNFLFLASINVKPSYLFNSLLITRFFISVTSLAKELDSKKINIIKNLMLNRYN